MMSTEHDETVFTEIVGEIEIPCDYDRLFHCGPDAARWVMTGRCDCGYQGDRLVCGGCKNVVLSTEEGLSCPEGCGLIHAPARHIFIRIEWLR